MRESRTTNDVSEHLPSAVVGGCGLEAQKIKNIETKVNLFVRAGLSKSEKKQSQSSLPDSADAAACAVAASSSNTRRVQSHGATHGCTWKAA